jgi:acyl-CoA thioester hydrolase
MEMPKAPERLRFRCSARTRWSDEDNQHVLNNAIYMTLLEEARFAYFSALGLLAQNQFPFVLAQTNIVFVAPGRGGVEVTLECGTTYIGSTSFTQSYRVRESASGKVWCTAEARLVAWDNQRATKGVITDEFRRAIERFEAQT